MYDVIIVGARVAGASTALLLARRGCKVLCLDRATFPSDTLSTHQIQLPGVARLKCWGLLDRIIAANTPATRNVKVDVGNVVLRGHFPTFEGVDALYAPRRTVLDKIIIDAARESGVDVREDVIVEELLTRDRCVVGVRGRTSRGQPICELAGLVIGADGRGSMVAKAVGAKAYHQKPILSAAYYAYWDGLRHDGGEIYARPRRSIGVWPTNDGLTLTYIALPIGDHRTFRADVAQNCMAALDLAGDLGERVRAARRVGRFLGTSYLPNCFRKPYGAGWALVGDAGLVMDPITGQGISDALRDAELVANAVIDGLGGRHELAKALRDFEVQRNRRVMPMYKLTVRQAAIAPLNCAEEVLLESLQGNQADIDQFLGVLAGVVPLSRFLSPGRVRRLLGLRGFAALLLRGLLPNRRSGVRVSGTPQVPAQVRDAD